MKKLLIITNFVWAAIFLIFILRCCQSETKSCKTISLDYKDVPTSGRIDLGFADTLADNYKTNHYPPGNTFVKSYGDVLDDARSVWFSLETLKQFLWEIESTSAGCEGCKTLNLGVRIYYAEYPETRNSTDKRYSKNDMKKHTVFMVPTYSKYDTDGKLQDYDFNPKHLTLNGKGSVCMPITLNELILEKNKTAFNDGTLKITQVHGATLDEILKDKFILAPHPESLVKKIAVTREPFIDKNNDTIKPKEKAPSLSLIRVPFGGLNHKYGVISNLLFISSAYGQSSDYVFQNHGALCPPYNCPGMAF